MANGVYGNIKPANITSADVDIFYHYRPTRNSESVSFEGFKKLNSNLLSTVNVDKNEVGYDFSDKLLTGMYDLKLPLDKFSEKGIYTVYIRPKEIKATILDVSTLAAYPDVRGIVFNVSEIAIGDQNLFTNNGLVGYRVEYFDNSARQSYFRIITSNNKCEPVTQNLNDSNQKSVRYRYNDSSNLVFCTLTPSTSTSFKSNALPFIGKTGQEVALVNTKFNPIMLEIEMTEHDIETVSTMLEGAQVRDLDHGLITTFNDKKEIYHQSEFAAVKDGYGKALFDYKKPRINNIDFTQDYQSTIGED